MEVKLGGWSRFPMPTMLKVGYGSSEVKWGQIIRDSRMEVKLGRSSRTSRHPMPKILKVG